MMLFLKFILFLVVTLGTTCGFTDSDISVLRNFDANPNPILVELFTSQGCSSCPPADRFLKELGDFSKQNKIPIVALSYHVDYWNYLGWKDPYSDTKSTDRQRYYAKALKDSVYTPQLIIHGKHSIVGSKRSNAIDAISKEFSQAHTPVNSCEINNTTEGQINLNVTRHETSLVRLISVQNQKSNLVHSGENYGEFLEHLNVSKEIFSQSIPKSKEKSTTLTIKNSDRHDLLVCIMQDPSSAEVQAIKTLASI